MYSDYSSADNRCLIVDGVLKKIEWKNSAIKEDTPKTLKKKL